MENSCIILLSSGLDSTYALLKAKEKHHIELAITFDYNQNAKQKEIEYAQKIAKTYEIEHKTISFELISEISNSTLHVQREKIPQPSYQDLNNKEASEKTAKSVWVPNRNGIFINMAAAVAESRGISFIYVGFNKEEGTTFPDNTPEFVTAINESLKYSTLNKVQVQSPPISLTKNQIVRELKEMDFDFGLIWSCYHSHEQMCGKCESCMRLKRALRENSLDVIIRKRFIDTN